MSKQVRRGNRKSDFSIETQRRVIEQRDPNVMTVTDADIDRQAEELARRELNVSAGEAYVMLEHGELEDTALAIELRMLDHLRRKPRNFIAQVII